MDHHFYKIIFPSSRREKNELLSSFCKLSGRILWEVKFWLAWEFSGLLMKNCVWLSAIYKQHLNFAKK